MRGLDNLLKQHSIRLNSSEVTVPVMAMICYAMRPVLGACEYLSVLAMNHYHLRSLARE
jgi:hypothetical protein